MSQPPLYASAPAPEPAKAGADAALLPCPFCGGEAEFTYGGSVHYLVECQDCEASTDMLHPEQAAIDAWNRRARTPEHEALLQAVREYLAAESSAAEDTAREELRRIANS